MILCRVESFDQIDHPINGQPSPTKRLLNFMGLIGDSIFIKENLAHHLDGCAYANLY